MRQAGCQLAVFPLLCVSSPAQRADLKKFPVKCRRAGVLRSDSSRTRIPLRIRGGALAH